MAAYTAYSDLSLVIQGKLDKWGIPTSNTATRDAEILKAANQAKALIDAHLTARYTGRLPFTTVPPLIKFISLHITIYLLAASQQKAGEEYQQNYDTAMALLKEVAAGSVPIFDEATNSAISASDSTLQSDMERYDDDDTRVFPASLIGKPLSSFRRTYRGI